MNLRHTSKLLAKGLIALALVQAYGAVAQTAPASQPGGPINLNFKDAEVDSVVGAFGHLLGKSFVIDPRVRGKISLETPRPVSRGQAFTLLKTVLRQQGFAIVDLGDLYKVVPEADAKLQSGPVEIGARNTRQGDEVITQVFQLNHESATTMIPVLRPLVSPNNTITAYAGNNTLVITDYAANLKRLAKVIATLDSPRPNATVEVVRIKNSIASDLAVAVSKLMDDGAQRGGGGAPNPAVSDPGQRVIVLADPRTNSVLLRSANSSKLALARSLIERLDQPISSEHANMRVVYLKNAEAVKLVRVLQGVLNGNSEGGNSNGGFDDSNRRDNESSIFGNSNNSTSGLASAFDSSGSDSSSAFGSQSGTLGSRRDGQSTQPVTVKAGGAIIAADPATNALIITAPEPVYRNLRSVIDQLDSRRAQIHIESLIVEVNANTVAEMGIQWQFLNASNSGGNTAFGGTNMGTGGTNILSVMQNPTALAGANGLNIGIVRSGTNMLGVPLNLGLLARALESETGANIRATPNLLTLDNEEARIIIGQNVPFITGQYTQTNNNVSSPFQTIERKDVGTTLRVRPQVSEGGTVKMEIFQEISALQSTDLAAGVVTSRRAIESHVLVDDGQIVVLGGLIEDRVRGGVAKVPLLGDIPFLGRLFRYDNREREKINLLVFLRPVVVRDAGAAWDVTSSRYDYISRRSTEGNFGDLAGVRDLVQPELDEMPPRPGSPNVRRLPPSVEPGLIPGAADESQALGVRAVPSLQHPQPDLPQAVPTLDLRNSRNENDTSRRRKTPESIDLRNQ